jgi:hypothetical protein
MSDLYNQIVNNRGSIENLLARIPGFRGYLDTSARREADRMLRDYLAGELDGLTTRFIACENTILDQGGLSSMSRTREIKSRLMAYRDDIKTAMPKYAGPMASITISEKELERIYAFDEAQIIQIDRIGKAVAALEAALAQGDATDLPLKEIEARVLEAREAFRLRDDELTNLSQSTLT